LVGARNLPLLNPEAWVAESVDVDAGVGVDADAVVVVVVDTLVEVGVRVRAGTGGAEKVVVIVGVGAGTNAGDLAYSSVHLRAVRSCCTRFLTYSVAMEGTVHTSTLIKKTERDRMMRKLTERIF
jgi:hypothetical protein